MDKIVKWMLILVCLPVCFSCADEETPYGFDPGTGEDAIIRFSLDKKEMPEVRFRSVGTDITDNIKYVHILVFNAANGTLKTKAYVPDYSGGPILVNTQSGGSVIYAVANLSTPNAGASTGPTFFDDVSSLIAFQKKMAKITRVTDFAEPLLIMFGKTGIISVQPGLNATMSIPMTRLSSQMVFNVIKKIPANERLDLYTWEVVNAPGYSYLEPKSADAVKERTETLNDSNYFRSSAQSFNSVTLSNGTAASQGKFYLFENRKGTVSAITSQKQRAAQAPARSSFIRIKGRYTDASGVRDLYYKIHLGKDSLTDFNVDRNCRYTYNITVKSATEYSTQVDVSKQDSRVDVNDLCKVDINEPILDAHYDWRPIRVRGKVGCVRIEVVDNNTGQPTSDADKQWLKLSLSATWPLAGQTALAPKSALTLQMNPTGTNEVMLYAYADEMFSGDTPLTSPRYLKLRVTFTPSTDLANLNNPDSCYVFSKQITQNPVLYTPTMGLRLFTVAGILEGNGGYMYGIERQEEAVMKLGFSGIAATGRTAMMQWGFYNYLKQLTTVVSNLFYRRNGMKNTVDLVWKTATTMYDQNLSADMGIPIGGQFDPIYNTYPARYCLEKNRDLNGDGVINGNEIKWFLPSRAQQVLFWLGKVGLGVASPVAPDESCWSSTEQTILYALNLNFYNGGTGGTFNKLDNLQHVRCIRKLAIPLFEDAVMKSPYVVANTRYISGLPASVTAHIGTGRPYPRHSAEDNANAVCSYLQVAKYDCGLNGEQLLLSGTVPITWAQACGWTGDDARTSASPATGCNAYWEGSENHSKTGKGKWRLPTQRELMCMNLLQTEFFDIVPFALSDYWACSQYYQEGWYTNMDSGYTGAANRNGGPADKKNVRCVRDARDN